MSVETIQTLGKYLVAVAAMAGCFAILIMSGSDNTQPWTIIGLIVGWIVRDSAGSSATSNAAKLVAAKPNGS